jgi:hypothetical protein
LKISCGSPIQVSAVQMSPSQLVVEVELKENRGTCHTLELNTDLQVKGVTVTIDHVALWSSKTLVVYQLITEGLAEDIRITSKAVGMYHLCVSVYRKS